MEIKTNGTTTRNCDHCGKPYKADNRNLKRGWGLCCSKSCAAKKREIKNGHKFAKRQQPKFTSEGYKIIDGTAYDEWGEPMYPVSEFDDQHPFDLPDNGDKE